MMLYTDQIERLEANTTSPLVVSLSQILETDVSKINNIKFIGSYGSRCSMCASMDMQKDIALYQQNAAAYTRTYSGGVTDWKSPTSQHSEIGGTTAHDNSGVVSPVSGRNELSP